MKPLRHCKQFTLNNSTSVIIFFLFMDPKMCWKKKIAFKLCSHLPILQILYGLMAANQAGHGEHGEHENEEENQDENEEEEEEGDENVPVDERQLLPALNSWPFLPSILELTFILDLESCGNFFSKFNLVKGGALGIM